MKRLLFAGATALGLLSAGAAFAQFNASSNYPNPNATQTQTYRTSNKVCGDPWVTIALEAVYGRGFDPIHCDIRNFRSGSWKDYNDLIHAVGEYKADNDRQSLSLFSTVVGGKTFVLVTSNLTPTYLATPPDFNLVDQGNGKMVAAGGGNMVAAGGGNMVAAGGGNMVAAGGGNALPKANAAIIAAVGKLSLKSGNVVVGLPPANVAARVLSSGKSFKFGSRTIGAK